MALNYALPPVTDALCLHETECNISPLLSDSLCYQALPRLLVCGSASTRRALHRARGNDYTPHQRPKGTTGEGEEGNRGGISRSNSSGTRILSLCRTTRSRRGNFFVRNAQADREPGLIRYSPSCCTV